MFLACVDLIFVGCVTVTFLVLHGLSMKNTPPQDIDSDSSSYFPSKLSWVGIIWRLVKGFPDFFLLGLFIVILTESLLALESVHCFLVSTGKTTNEFFK